MNMTPGDIALEYRQSANPRMQIGILADMNCCSKEEIIEVLKEQGCDVPEMKKKGRPKTVGKSQVKPEKVTYMNEPVPTLTSDQIQTVKAIPEIVKSAISEKMVSIQELIDQKKEEIVQYEEQLKTLNAYIQGTVD